MIDRGTLSVRDSFFGITESQLITLEEFYRTHHKLLYHHRRDWRDYYDSTRVMMLEVNKLMQNISKEKFDRFLVKYVFLVNKDASEEEYLMVKNYWVAAFFKVSTGDCYLFHQASWKSTGMYFWSSSSVGYGYASHPSHSFYRYDYKPSENDLELIYRLPEFKYIDLTKLEYVNLYTLLNNRFQKNHLWQIEMLIKSNHIRLATELAASYQNIDLKIFRQYQDFFRLKGKGLWHYHELIKIRNEGFEDVEFIYLDTYESVYEKFWINFLSEHPEINRKKFIKYLKGRKTTKTIFGETFLEIYKLYLLYIAELGLDMSKDKFTFPEDLIETFKEILLIINYDHRNRHYYNCLMNWQSELPIGEMDPRYELDAIQKSHRDYRDREAHQRLKELMKKQKEEMNRNLEIIWQTNRLFNIEINDSFILVAPKSADDLYIEGKTLNHCVYDYLDRIGKKETAILFIRKKNYPNKPFYTVEVKNQSVVQCRSTNNLDPGNIATFFSEWINQNIDVIKESTAMAVA